MANDSMLCSQCQELTEPGNAFYIDDTLFCAKCMYGGLEPFEVYPIGFVRNNLDRDLEREFGRIGNPQDESRIELLASQEPFMYSLEEEATLTVIYYFHRSKPPRSKLRRKPDLKEVGVFASHCPDRLSRLAVTDVQLVRVEGLTLVVTGLDAINGSPVLDIKAPAGSAKRMP